ncbi:MAG: TIGR02302 family protein [Alphaproteobacteria bacterium]|nr:TIGR02302 family protein [Alphaproteobacteria bacterium]
MTAGAGPERPPLAGFLGRLKREAFVAASGAILLAERLLVAFWPLFAVLGVFLALALAGVLESVGYLAHSVLLAATLIASLLLALRGLRALAPPKRAEALARLEETSALANQPLQALEDKPARLEGAAGAALWRAHLARARDAARALRLGPPRAVLSEADPWSLHFLAVLVLFLGVLVAGPDWRERVAAAFTPRAAAAAAAGGPVRLAWIEPPAYTGLPPVYLSADTDRVPPVPSGAKLVVRLPDARSATLVLKSQDGGQGNRAKARRLPLERDEGGALEASVPLDGDLSVRLVEDRLTRAEWTIPVTPDRIPAVSWDGDLGRTERGALKLGYLAADDFGIAAVELLIGHAREGDEDQTMAAGDIARTIPLATPARREKRLAEAPFIDLTADPWAGLEVSLALRVRDQLGQEATAPVRRIRLPERQFTDPLAQAIIEIRRALASGREPPASSAYRLDELSRGREEEIKDAVVYLGLRAAHYRLLYSPVETARGEVVDLLWQLALRLEDGDLSMAQNALRERIEALKDALDKGADGETLNRLIEDVAAALERYMKAMASAGTQAPQSSVLEAPALTPEDLGDLMSEIRSLMETGSSDAARARLGDLSDLIETLRPPSSGQSDPRAEALSRAYEELRSLTEDQTRLIDRTFAMGEDAKDREQQRTINDLLRQLHRRGAKPEEAEPDWQDGAPYESLAGDQDRLGERLDALSGPLADLGKLADSSKPAFGEAREAMEGAGDALREGNGGRALRAQQRAVEALREAAEAIVKSLAEASQQAGGGRPGARPTDPLGRPLGPFGGRLGTDHVDVPDVASQERARKILEEIRQRLEDRTRPRPEQDYLERLTPRF